VRALNENRSPRYAGIRAHERGRRSTPRTLYMSGAAPVPGNRCGTTRWCQHGRRGLGMHGIGLLVFPMNEFVLYPKIDASGSAVAVRLPAGSTGTSRPPDLCAVWGQRRRIRPCASWRRALELGPMAHGDGHRPGCPWTAWKALASPGFSRGFQWRSARSKRPL